MQQVFPPPAPGDRAGGPEPYGGLTLPPGTAEQPWWAALCMVSSLDGAASLAGRSGGIGDDADRRALARLRDAADAVLVGAATVREEGYGPLVPRPERRDDRVARGLAPVPRLAILTRTADLDPRAAVFGHAEQRPLVLAPSGAVAAARDRLGERAEVLEAGEGRVAPRHALAALAERGLPRVLCEGGPTVNAQLLDENLIDEVFLTLGPLALGGSAPRIAQGTGPEERRPMRLESVWEHDSELFLRYRARRHPPATAS